MTLSKLKKKLWSLTSKYVRLKHADHRGFVSCVTCGHSAHYTALQCGHFIPKAQGLGIYFDLRNLAVQCYRCNINLGGNGAEYYPYMLERYGQATIDELKRLSNMTIKFTQSDYEERIEAMEEMLKEIL